MRRAIPLLLCGLLLGACNMPNPKDGLSRSGSASAGGHSFRVNWSDSAAQATRTNRVWLPRRDEVLPAAVEATEAVSGCRVRAGSVDGDVSLVKMRLDCGG